MKIEQELQNVLKVHRENLELEAKIEELQGKIGRNHKLIIKHFFPYLLSIYEKWRPSLEEKIMAMDFESQCCFELTIKTIDGHMIRAQEGEKQNVYHRFELNPKLKEYVVPHFIIPKSSYNEIKKFFKFTLLK